MCRVETLSYDWRTRTGEVHFPQHNCCDMSGCNDVFVAIDPEVRMIRTFTGGKHDTVYKKYVSDSPDWTVLVPR
jgi:hypothetical protein